MRIRDPASKYQIVWSEPQSRSAQMADDILRISAVLASSYQPSDADLLMGRVVLPRRNMHDLIPSASTYVFAYSASRAKHADPCFQLIHSWRTQFTITASFRHN